MPPTRLKVCDVPKYLKDKYNLEITRQTVYNWLKLGLNNETLQHTTVRCRPAFTKTVIVTTVEWLHDFFHRAGIPVPNLEHPRDRRGPDADGDPAKG